MHIPAPPPDKTDKALQKRRREVKRKEAQVSLTLVRKVRELHIHHYVNIYISAQVSLTLVRKVRELHIHNYINIYISAQVSLTLVRKG